MNLQATKEDLLQQLQQAQTQAVMLQGALQLLEQQIAEEEEETTEEETTEDG